MVGFNAGFYAVPANSGAAKACSGVKDDRHASLRVAHFDRAIAPDRPLFARQHVCCRAFRIPRCIYWEAYLSRLVVTYVNGTYVVVLVHIAHWTSDIGQDSDDTPFSHGQSEACGRNDFVDRCRPV